MFSCGNGLLIIRTFSNVLKELIDHGIKPLFN